MSEELEKPDDAFRTWWFEKAPNDTAFYTAWAAWQHQAAEIAALREALKPFADAAKHIPAQRTPDHFGCHVLREHQPTIGDLRRAAAAYGGKK